MSEQRDVTALPSEEANVTTQRFKNVPTPARTLQPGDVTQEGLVVKRVTPHFGLLAIRFEDDDTLWRVHRDTILRLRVAA